MYSGGGTARPCDCVLPRVFWATNYKHASDIRKVWSDVEQLEAITKISLKPDGPLKIIDIERCVCICVLTCVCDSSSIVVSSEW